MVTDRLTMVSEHLQGRDIHDQRVLEAFRAVPRELFVPPEWAASAYADEAIPIGHGQTISQPYVVALMIQELDLRPTDRVLDVGAGSGYQTAILARLCEHVYAIERIEALTERAVAALSSLNVRNVTFMTGDGTLGWPGETAFNRIICGAAAPDVPPAWIDQLVDGGRIVLPIGGADFQTLTSVDKRGKEIGRRNICDVRFVKLIGRAGWPELEERV